MKVKKLVRRLRVRLGLLRGAHESLAKRVTALRSANDSLCRRVRKLEEAVDPIGHWEKDLQRRTESNLAAAKRLLENEPGFNEGLAAGEAAAAAAAAADVDFPTIIADQHLEVSLSYSGGCWVNVRAGDNIPAGTRRIRVSSQPIEGGLRQ